MTTDQIIFGLAVFLLAGTVKGLVGLGLPTIVIALTTLVLPLTEAIAMIALPTIFSNVWQAAVGGNFWKILRRQWPLMVPLAIGLYLTMWLVGQKGIGPSSFWRRSWSSIAPSACCASACTSMPTWKSRWRR